MKERYNKKMDEDRIGKEIVEDLKKIDFIGSNGPDDIKFLAKGNATLNYLITASGKKYVVRVYTGEGSFSRISKEAMTMNLAAEKDLAPKALFLTEKTNVGYPIMIVKYVDGEDLVKKKSQAENYFEKYIGLLGKIHTSFRFSWWGELNGLENGTYFDKLNDSIRSVQTKFYPGEIHNEYLNGVIAKVMIELGRIKELLMQGSDFHLLHGDYLPGNVMVKKSGELVAIDWSVAEVGDPAYECVHVAAHSWWRPREFINFLNVYRKYSPVDDGFIRRCEGYFRTLTLGPMLWSYQRSVMEKEGSEVVKRHPFYGTYFDGKGKIVTDTCSYRELYEKRKKYIDEIYAGI